MKRLVDNITVFYGSLPGEIPVTSSPWLFGEILGMKYTSDFLLGHLNIRRSYDNVSLRHTLELERF